MDSDTKPTSYQRNPEHQSTSSSPEILEETNQQPKRSIEEAAARITKERAALTEKLKKVDMELAACDQEIYRSYFNLAGSQGLYWNGIKSSLSKKRHMYNCSINSVNNISTMLDETSMRLEEAEIKSTVESLQGMVESVQRNVRQKIG